jgi:hypothetical protein
MKRDGKKPPRLMPSVLDIPRSDAHERTNGQKLPALHLETLGGLMEKLYAYMTPLYQPPSI